MVMGDEQMVILRGISSGSTLTDDNLQDACLAWDPGRRLMLQRHDPSVLHTHQHASGYGGTVGAVRLSRLRDSKQWADLQSLDLNLVTS